MIIVQALNINSKDVALIGNELYCRTPEALELTLVTLREIGYEVKDQRLDGFSIQRGETTPQEMEKNGWALWYASLDISQGKCGSCYEHISTRDIEMHGHRCEMCGDITYLQMTKGGRVRFRFITDGAPSIFPQLNMAVVYWDTDEGYLYLDPVPLAYAGLGVVYGKKALAYLDEHSDKWNLVNYEGKPTIAVRYAQNSNDCSDDVIELYDVVGTYSNFTIVKVWEGVEYPKYGKKLPIPESLDIYELWHLTDASPNMCTG